MDQCLHNMEEENDNGLDEACEVVRSILDQVTLNDSPPMNDLALMAFGPNQQMGKNQNKESTSSTVASQPSSRPPPSQLNSRKNFSRQQHIQPYYHKPDQKSSTTTATQSSSALFSRGLASSVATATCSTRPDIASSQPISPTSSVQGQSTVFDLLHLGSHTGPVDLDVVPEGESTDILSQNTQTKRTRSDEVTSMGHRSLAALCLRTLDSVADTYKPEMVVVRKKTAPKVLDSQFANSPSWNDQLEKAPSNPSPPKDYTSILSESSSDDEDSSGEYSEDNEDKLLLSYSDDTDNYIQLNGKSSSWQDPDSSEEHDSDNKLTTITEASFDETVQPSSQQNVDTTDKDETMILDNNFPNTPKSSPAYQLLYTPKAKKNKEHENTKENIEQIKTNQNEGGISEEKTPETLQKQSHKFTPINSQRITADDIPPDSAISALTAYSSATASTSSFPLFQRTNYNDQSSKYNSVGEGSKRRIQMFGCEYAKHLSRTPFSPQRQKSKSNHFSFKNKKKSTKSNQSASAAAASANYPDDLKVAGQKTDFKRTIGVTYSGPTGGVILQNNEPPKSPKSKYKSIQAPKVSKLEEASDAIIAGAITDIVITHGDDVIPKGFYHISQTGDGTGLENIKRIQSSGLLPGSKRTASVNLCVKKESNWDRAVQRPCVTALAVIFPDRNEFVPPGFCVVRRYCHNEFSNNNDKNNAAGSNSNSRKPKSSSRGGDPENDSNDSSLPANLNYGSSGERVYLCYRRSREGNPITGIIPLQPSKNEPIPEGYTVLEQTPRNHVADINSKAGSAIFLAFRQRLANLEPLRPLPLVLSVYYAMLERNEKEARAEKKGKPLPKKKKTQHLAAYYCTGGTVVAADVGRFHIMDRSTHPLLSPSSVTSRLTLIKASRVKRMGADQKTENGPTLESPTGISVFSGDKDNFEESGHTPENSPSVSPNRISGTSVSPNVNRKSSAFDVKSPVPFPTVESRSNSSFTDTNSVLSDSSSDLTNTLPGKVQASTNLSLDIANQNIEKSHESSFPSYFSPRHGSLSDKEKQYSDSNGKIELESKTFERNTDMVIDPPSLKIEERDFTFDTPRSVDDDFFTESSLNSNEKSNQKKSRHVFIHEDAFIQSCFDAMAFIPSIECPSLPLPKDDNLSVDTGSVYDSEEFEYARTLLQVRVAILTPILTACYTHHGGSALIAVEGLSKLLGETSFFMPDVLKPSDGSGSTKLTLLDLAIQVVCDVATSTSRETYFLSCVEFVRDAIRYCSGNLNTRTIGYVVRFYLFIFYFGASIPTASSWPNSTIALKKGKHAKERADEYLLKEYDQSDNKSTRVYLPGGAPQAAALALKELVTRFLGETVAMNPSFFFLSSQSPFERLETLGLDASQFVGSVVSSIVDSAVHHVDVANYTQLALHQIHRSGGSELFWHDMMTSCGIGLFSSDKMCPSNLRNSYVISFAILASIVKVTSGKVRRVTQTSELVPRDVSSKLLALELLYHFLVRWRKTVSGTESSPNDKNEFHYSSNFKEEERKDTPSVATMAYTIRRLVVPCLLSNTGPGLEDIRVFRRMIRIISELWSSTYYRHHLKMELGVLMEHFVLKMLRLGPQVLPPKRIRDLGTKHEKTDKSSAFLDGIPSSLLSQQLTILNEIKIWFSPEPKAILELFLNFDQVDSSGNEHNFRMMPSTHWKLTEQICGVLCHLVEQCNEIIIEQIRVTKTNVKGLRILNAQHNSTSLAVSDASPHFQSHQGTDLVEMAKIRDGTRQLQAKCFDVIARIVRSIMICAAAASGANYEQLKRGLGTHGNITKSKVNKLEAVLRNAKEESKLVKKQHRSDDSVSLDASSDTDGKTMTTIENIVGGLKTKTDLSSLLTSFEPPMSPRTTRRHLSLSPVRGTISSPRRIAPRGDGIVEYWQVSIAAERRKVNMSPNSDLRLKLKQQQSDNQKRVGDSGKISRGMPPLSPAKPPTPNRLTHEYSGNTDNIMKEKKETSKNDNGSLSSHRMEEALKVAFEIMTTKSLKKALEYLIACNFLTPSPRDIASFLRLYQAKLDPMILGEYLGEGGKDGADVEYFNLIRFSYVRAISFVGMNVEQG